MVKVIASQVRKGNVLEDEDGKLYIVLSAENFHPGKGTPTTQIDMRRISDGIKVSVRYKTTDQCERAFVETVPYTFLYEDGDGYVFMNPNNYEQVTVPRDILGDQSVYMQENMECMLSLHNGIPIAIELPARVTLEVVETEPVVKGQTAASPPSSRRSCPTASGPRCHRISSGHPHRGDDRGRPMSSGPRTDRQPRCAMTFPRLIPASAPSS